MRTLDQFLAESEGQGSINLTFEYGMYSIVNDLERIVHVFREAGAPFEVVDGIAVNAHIVPLHRSRSFVTRDIDVLLHRRDLERVASAAEPLGYLAKKMMGGYVLIRPEQDFAEAVRLIFVGEKSKSTQPLPHPQLHPEVKDMFGVAIPVAPLLDLLGMKLNSFRPKDLTHIEILDDVGLISPALERELPPVLQVRLKEARAQIAGNKPDLEG